MTGFAAAIPAAWVDALIPGGGRSSQTARPDAVTGPFPPGQFPIVTLALFEAPPIDVVTVAVAVDPGTTDHSPPVPEGSGTVSTCPAEAVVGETDVRCYLRIVASIIHEESQLALT
jgi:hypothetical protein